MFINLFSFSKIIADIFEKAFFSSPKYFILKRKKFFEYNILEYFYVIAEFAPSYYNN